MMECHSRTAASFHWPAWKRWLRIFAMPIAVLCTGGCTTVESLTSGTSSDKYYFGVIRIQENGNQSPNVPRLQRTTGVGLQVDNAVSVGYFSRVQVSIPKDCHLIVINKAGDANDRLLSALGGTNLCTVGLSD